MKKFDTLTKSEMQVMNILWEIGKGSTIHEIIAKYEEPKPAYTTVATFLKILLNKGFVEFCKLSGKTHTYYPLITKQQYTRMVMKDVQDSFFGGSGASMVKFFVEQEKMNEKEIQELIELIRSGSIE
ncbi:MAG: BlaI/MecI/CopY family transcriptional regulator [Bacteroidaceae bacterium]|nr:BlaI/MecI/CopY family transcriptional regulator [Bacteroidaceae bacterium]